MALLAGQSVGLVREIRPAADILRETVTRAEHVIRELSAQCVKPSEVGTVSNLSDLPTRTYFQGKGRYKEPFYSQNTPPGLSKNV